MNFLDLPVKAREHILRLLLTRPCPVDVLFEKKRISRYEIQDECLWSEDDSAPRCGYLRSYGRQFLKQSSNRWTCVGPLFCVAVLRVCKQIYLEGSKILYAANRFILTSTAPEGFPLPKIQSLQITAVFLDPGKGLIKKYQELIGALPTDNSSLRLTVASRVDDQTFSHDLAASLLSLAPVKSCSLSIAAFKDAQSLAKKLTGQQENRHFQKYNLLPKELRLQILSYTDLAQNYQISRGKPYYNKPCCMHCCEVLFPCCCNTLSHIGHGMEAGSRYSDRCRCRLDPQNLLKVSRGFRMEALEVMFSRASQFRFGGQMKNHLIFFRHVQTHLPQMRRLCLRMDREDCMEQNAKDVHWTELVDILIAHCTLPLMSITIIAQLFWGEPDSEDEASDEESYQADSLKEHQIYYSSFIPGLRRLVENGLKELNFEFLGLLESWTDDYRKEIFGERLQPEQDE